MDGLGGIAKGLALPAIHLAICLRPSKYPMSLQGRLTSTGPKNGDVQSRQGQRRTPRLKRSDVDGNWHIGSDVEGKWHTVRVGFILTLRLSGASPELGDRSVTNQVLSPAHVAASGAGWQTYLLA